MSRTLRRLNALPTPDGPGTGTGGQGGDGAASSGAGAGSGTGGSEGTQNGPQNGQGGSGSGSGGQGTGQAGTGTQGAGQGGTGQGGQTGGQAPTGERVEDLPEWAQRVIRDTRGEAAENRTGRTTAEQERDTLRQALDGIRGVLDPKGQQDPAEAAQTAATERDQARQAERSARIGLAVHQAAGAAGADPARLVDSQAFAERVRDLDPAADGFGDRLAEAIRAHAEAHPHVRATPQGPARSGTEFTGGGSTPPSGERPKSIAAAMKGAGNR